MPYLNKTCGKCGATKPTEAFSRCKQGFQAACKECQRAYKAAHRERIADQQRARRAADPAKYSALNRMRRYGITQAQYDALLASQGGRCAICSATEPGGKHGTWHIDHAHACCPGERSCGACVRGLLCHRCNIGIGHFADNTAVIAAALRYLACPSSTEGNE